MKHKHESSRHVSRTRPQLCHITRKSPQSTQLTYHISAMENNMAAWKRTTHIDRSCFGGIITGIFVSLLIKKYQQDKK